MKSEDYDRNVFVNCSFDPSFLNMFRAIVYIVHDCGFIVRCAQETGNASGVRIDKIIKIILDCRFGIHDLSCIQLTEDSPLPRFNMPYELGVFMGAKSFGDTNQKKKDFLVLDSEPHRYKRLISDLAGYDFPPHHNNTDNLIEVIRDWLAQSTNKAIPGSVYFQNRYQNFLLDYPLMCAELHYNSETLNFIEYYALVAAWIQNERNELLNDQ